MRQFEQVCPGERGAYRRHLKRAMVRSERRAAKRDPEGAPRKRVYRGYST